MADFPQLAGRTVVLDTETTGLEWHRGDRPFGVALAIDSDPAMFIDERTEPRVWEWLANELPKAGSVTGHNLKFDAHMLRTKGVMLPPDLGCTMTYAALLDEHQVEYNLDSCAMIEGVGRKLSLPGKTNMLDLPPEQVAEYAINDVELTRRLADIYTDRIIEQELERVVELEMSLLPVLADMEWGGVRVDLEAAHAAVPKLTARIDEIQADINRDAGRPLNVNSPKQIRELFNPKQLTKISWELRDGTIVGPTKGGGNPSIDQHALRAMRDPMAAKIMALRKTIKTRDTFVLGHVIGHADENGFVHTTFNQTKTDGEVGTGTGRLSSTDPALQQINKRDKLNAAIVRALFLPDTDEEEWLCLDYDQVDFRMAAHLINDERILAAYAANPQLDYHGIVSEMTKIPRNPEYAGGPNAKQLNLSLAFGAGAGKTAFTMGMPYTLVERNGRVGYEPGPEALAVLDQYHARLPGVRKFMKRAELVAKSRGYVRTAIGRRLRFPRGLGAHKAAGLLFQAYAADMHKIGLVQVAHAIKEQKLPTRLLLSVHDEIGLSAPHRTDLADAVRVCYTDGSRLALRVPITSGVDWGKNWYEASV